MGKFDEVIVHKRRIELPEYSIKVKINTKEALSDSSIATNNQSDNKVLVYLHKGKKTNSRYHVSKQLILKNGTQKNVQSLYSHMLIMICEDEELYLMTNDIAAIGRHSDPFTPGIIRSNIQLKHQIDFHKHL